MAVETLTEPPSLAPVLASSVLHRRRGGASLPGDVLRLEGFRARRGRLIAYERLCGFAVGDRLPHTFPHVVGFPLQAALMARGEFPLPLVGLVHVENEITVHRPLAVTEPLDVTVSAHDLRPHRRGTVVDLVTEVEVAGERVWEGRSTYLSRGEGAADAPSGTPAPALPGGPPAARWRLAGDLGRRYAAVSGDVNPIHLHPLTARALGFPRAIAHGMWTAARTVAALGPSTSGPSTSHAWFRKPVLLPGVVDLVVDRTGAEKVAGLRSGGRPGTEHLVLTFRTR